MFLATFVDDLMKLIQKMSFHNRPTSLAELFVSFFFSVSMGLLIVWFYKKSYRGFGYTTSFTLSLPLMAAVTSLVMLIISTNVAAAFSLIGALSIIRFRTAVKDTRDTSFMFFAIAIGMAGGIGFYWEGLAFTLLAGSFTVLASANSDSSKFDREKMLLVRWQDNADTKSIDPILESCTRSHRILTEEQSAKRLEVTHLLVFSDPAQSRDLVSKTSNLAGVEEVRLLHGDQHIT